MGGNETYATEGEHGVEGEVEDDVEEDIEWNWRRIRHEDGPNRARGCFIANMEENTRKKRTQKTSP